MTENLDIFSTIDDLRTACDEVLRCDIDKVRRGLVLEYIFELRRKVEQLESGSSLAHSAPSAPPESYLETDESSEVQASSSTSSQCLSTTCSASASSTTLEPQRDLSYNINYSDWENQAKKARSGGGNKIAVLFKNDAKRPVNLIDKSDGYENVVWFILPGITHWETTRTHNKFIARDSNTGKLKLFDYDFTTSVVFSAHEFDVPNYDRQAIVSICDPGPIKEPGPIIENPVEVEVIPEGEIAVKESKSLYARKKFTAHFRNNTNSNVDLIWKNYQGNDHRIKEGLTPGDLHVEMTYFTHSFAARDSVTQRLRSFNYNFKTNFVFEGESFGVKKGEKVTISICDSSCL